jgi:hypothetical protein
MKDGKPDQRRAWFDLERFRSARAFGQSGCVLTLLIATGAVLRLISVF